MAGMVPVVCNQGERNYMIISGKRRRTGSLQCERSGVWTMRVMLGGKVYSRTAGTKDREKARIGLSKFVSALECEHARASAPGALLKEWPRYESSAEAARLSPGLRMNRYRAWRYFSAWMGGAHPGVACAAGVTRRMVGEYMDFFGERRSAMTFNLCICHLRGIFRVLLGKKADASNPLDSVAPKFSDSRPRRELSADEVRRIVMAADCAGGEWPRLIAIAVYTGLRLGDCCRLKWESVNLAQGVIQLVPHKTRRYASGRVVTIPIHEQLMASLAATPAAGRLGYVLPGIAVEYETARWRITKGLDRIFDGAGIVKSVMYEGRRRLTPSATFHSLRHSFVSFAANAGVPLVIVQAIVGHTSTAMTRHYYHPDESALRRAVNAIPSFGAGGAIIKKGMAYAEPSFEQRTGALRRASVAQRLLRAERLLKDGLISEEEHSALRARILAQV